MTPASGGDSPEATMRRGRAPGRPRARAGQPRWGTLSLWLVPAVVVVVWTGLFGLSYLAALARPVPHHIPLALVAPAPATARIVDALHHGAPGTVDPHGYRHLGPARAALLARRVDGVLVSGPSADTLYVAGAAGPPIATVLGEVAGTLAAHRHVPLVTHDVVPLPAGDSSGLGLFYLVLACVLGGYVGTIMVLAHTGPLPPGRRAMQLAATAVACGATLVTLARFALGSDPLPVPAAAAVAALTVFAVAVCTWALLAGLGRLAVPVAIGVFVVLGSPSSGGAIPRALLPGFYSGVGRWLPNGAAVSALRDLTFFPTASTARPLLVLGGWTLAGLASALILSRRHHRRAPEHAEAQSGASPP